MNRNQLIIGLTIVGVSVLLGIILFFTRASVPKEVTTEKSTLVETIMAEKTDENIAIEAFGTIQEFRKISIFPEVNGRVIEISDDLIVGGIIDKGQIILRIDPRDYLSAVEQEKAAVEKAEFDLKVEEGKKVVAEREWELLDLTLKESELARELALRNAHLRQRKAALAAAQSRLKKAEIDLQRTVISSPFNAIVLEETVEIGQWVSPQTPIAILISTDEFRVQVSVPYSRLDWITINQNEPEKNSKVRIIQELGNGERLEWDGRVLRLLVDVEPVGRLARLHVGIKDPLGLQDKKKGFQPLLLGTYVRVEIDGPTLEDVFVIPRKAVRDGDRVWIKNANNELEFREIEIAVRRENDVIIKDNIKEGEEIVISPIPVAIPGMSLRSINE